MSQHTPRRRRILQVIALVTVLLVVIGVLVVRSIISGGGKTSEIPIEEVIRRYEQTVSTPLVSVVAPLEATSTTGSTGSTSATTQGTTQGTTSGSTSGSTSVPVTPTVLAEPGVYVYATIGHDSIDVVGGVQHDYPETTTITIVPDACGVLQRWDVVAERAEEWRRCAVDGGVMESARMNHDEFFDIDQTDRYECSGDPRPLDAGAVTTWSNTCRLGGRDVVRVGTVIGVEPITVGGTAVDALHVRVTIDNGKASDQQITDSWYRVGTDLLLVQTASNHTTNSTAFGVVHYVEEYEIRLTSLVPVG